MRYEIARSITKGNGLLTVDIHGVRNSDQNTSEKGSNPLDAMGLYKTEKGVFLAEWSSGKWVRYTDYTLAIPEKDLWFDPPRTTTVVPLSKHCMRYDFTAQDGRKNLGGWIEVAAGLAGR